MTEDPAAKTQSNADVIVGEYRTMIAEGKPKLIVLKGFNWAALIFGPFWALAKSFWPAAILLIVIHGVLNMLRGEMRSAGYLFLAWAVATFQLVLVIIFGAMANNLYAAYLSSKGYKVFKSSQENNDASK